MQAIRAVLADGAHCARAGMEASSGFSACTARQYVAGSTTACSMLLTQHYNASAALAGRQLFDCPADAHPMISSSTWLFAAVMAGPFTAQCSCTVLVLRLG